MAEMDVLMQTERTFPPPEDFAKQANANDPGIYEEADADPEKWWASWADELEWIEPYETVLDWSDPPHAKWFAEGKLNASANCLDRHVAGGQGRAWWPSTGRARTASAGTSRTPSCSRRPSASPTSSRASASARATSSGSTCR